MWVTLHAIALIVLPLATLIAIVLRPRHTRVHEWLLLGIIPLAAGVLTGVSLPCLCFRPHAWSQVFIPAACLAASLVGIRPRGLRVLFAVVSLSLLVGLWLHHEALLDSGQWTSPELARHSSRARAQISLSGLKRELRSIGEADHTAYPAGWLEALPLKVTAEPEPEQAAGAAWHTWITGLYRRVDSRREFWYPGGTPTVAAESVELRRLNEQ